MIISSAKFWAELAERQTGKCRFRQKKIPRGCSIFGKSGWRCAVKTASGRAGQPRCIWDVALLPVSDPQKECFQIIGIYLK